MILIYKAKRVDDNEYAEGGYIENFFDLEHNEYIGEVIYDLAFNYHKIDQSTLEISFDDGVTYYELDEFADVVDANIDLFDGGSR